MVWMVWSFDFPLDRVGLARSGGEARLAFAAGDDWLSCDWATLLARFVAVRYRAIIVRLSKWMGNGTGGLELDAEMRGQNLLESGVLMRIPLKRPPGLRRLLDVLESNRSRIWARLFTLVAIQGVVTVILHSWVGLILWGAFAVDLVFLAALRISFLLSRTRCSLRHQAGELLRQTEEGTVLDLRRAAKNAARLDSFAGVFVYWALLAIILFPYSHSRWTRAFLGPVFSNSGYEGLLTLWQVHATLLGFFLVMLAFVFQLVGYKLAYETSLLSFLVQRARFGPIIVVNFAFILLDMVALIYYRVDLSGSTLAYGLTLGLAFDVISSMFLLVKTVQLLRYETIESGLTDLIIDDITRVMRTEQMDIIAEAILENFCRNNMIEYARLDVHTSQQSIVSNGTGVVHDINLSRLRKFARGLKGNIGGGPAVRRAIVLRSLGDRIVLGQDLLARITVGDATDQNARDLNRCFTIRET